MASSGEVIRLVKSNTRDSLPETCRYVEESTGLYRQRVGFIYLYL